MFIYHKDGSLIKELRCSTLEEADLEGDNLEGADLSMNDLRGANLRGANLEEANLYRASLEEANLRGANLSGANLSGADSECVNLEGANLKGANLEDALLIHANLVRANLAGAYLVGTNLRAANLEGANLEDANLEGAYLKGANLLGVNLKDARLKNAELDFSIEKGLIEKVAVHALKIGCLNMSSNYTNETTRSLAGWACFLAEDQDVVKRHTPEIAGLLLLGVDAYSHFFDGDEQAKLYLSNFLIDNKENDIVNKPTHYNQGEIECIDAVEAALTPEEFIGSLKFQVIKYVWRMGRKGAPLEDAEKARYYLNKLVGELSEQKNG